MIGPIEMTKNDLLKSTSQPVDSKVVIIYIITYNVITFFDGAFRRIKLPPSPHHHHCEQH